jgi:hypothetical protein
MWLGVVVGSVLLSALPRMPGFVWLHEHVPALGVIRCYSRAGQLALVGMAVLAGYGAARLFGARGRGGVALAIALVAAVNLEALRAPLAYREFPGIPAIYDVLRDEPRAVVIELPFYGRGGFFGNARYMINATRHRHPLVNGYSGFAPPGLEQTAETMRAFPGDEALDWMRTLGVTHIVVHRNTPQMQRRRALMDASTALRLVAERDGVAIYRMVDVVKGGGTKGSDPFITNP